ncbi:apyrase [Venturia canescens]|uniref:apyrase n=1 Tax=Venturia canescens TaxID=32260 RepID=UPI001C9C438B|nr:apyrase [Venturia canescens]
MKMLRDWRQALHTPHVYRVGNSSLRLQHQFFGVILLVVTVPFLFYCYPWIHGSVCSSHRTVSHLEFNDYLNRVYNSTYPLTPPVKMSSISISYKIGIISDLDKESKDATKKNTWFSILKYGHLFWMPRNNLISVSWDNEETKLSSTLSMGGRGMELSELVTFDGALLTFDDRTGIVHQIDGDRVNPWVILMDGNGQNSKGFKSEWATVKNQLLYVGSMGKEWTTSGGEFEHNKPMWIYVITPSGEKRSYDWTKNYKRLRQSLNIEFPGYMIHESGAWSEYRRSWFFLPRRCSTERYNETTDESMSCNVLLSTDENFTSVKVTKLDNHVPIRGFSSFKFLPGSNDFIIVALKSEEYRGQTATYITAFTIYGQILLPDEKIADHKFEGFEFV